MISTTTQLRRTEHHNATMASAYNLPSTADADGLVLGLSSDPQGNDLTLEGFTDFTDALLTDVDGMTSLPAFTPSYEFDTFSTTFEDPFPYSSATAVPRPYELVAPHREPDAFHESTSPQDEEEDGRLDNKLLSFSAPTLHAAVADDAGQFGEVAMTAELFGMFFLAEDVYSTETTGRPLELTCYRRNLWWCSGQITLPRQVVHVVTDQGRRLTVVELAASISATESIEGKATEIISIPWKSTASASHKNGNSNNNNGEKSEKTEKPEKSLPQHEEVKVAGSPPNVSIDLANGQENENGTVSIPVAWKRLQFKHATANNGRRKGQQQHYVVHIQLLARVQEDPATGTVSTSSATVDTPGKDDTNQWIQVADIQSGPVIVRGRSPRNFVSRRDVPVSGTTERKHQHVERQVTNANASASANAASVTPTPTATIPIPRSAGRNGSVSSESSQSFQRYHSATPTLPSNNWPQPYNQSPRPMKKIALSPSITRPPVPTWNNNSQQLRNTAAPTKPVHPHHLQQQHHHQPQPQPQPQPQQVQRSNSISHPINLSLSDEERSPPGRAPGQHQQQQQQQHHDVLSDSPPARYAAMASLSGLALPIAGMPLSSGAKGTTTTGSTSPTDENGDLLYEYFPLSLDDWMPPVDAIYRPHVVHHTIVPPEVKAQQVRNKTKRYFAAE